MAESGAHEAQKPQENEEGREMIDERPRPVSEKDIPALLQQLALTPPNTGDAASAKAHKFWKTQPVPQFREPNMMQTTDTEKQPEGAIISKDVCRALIARPEVLVDGFEWCELDLTAPDEIKEVYELLDLHYVEDNEGSFRFNYSPEFISWALKPPGWRKDWHIGVRTKSSTEGKRGKLVAFISGVPAKIRVQRRTLNAVEINFLTIHRKLRNKRLAPVLIKEITRRCYKAEIFQALYTAGTLLPTPISTCRYFHRSLEWDHLYKCGFTSVPRNSSEIRQRVKYRLPPQTKTNGLRPMKASDVPAVRKLLMRYNERFQMRQEFSEQEVRHFLCSEASQGVVWSYVVEHNGKISDFISYYLLESTVLKSGSNDKIRAAYMYYYASESAFSVDETSAQAQTDILQKRLQELVQDILILAKRAGCHVFNALTLQDNPLFLKDQRFEPGDGKLHYYLFNWRTAQLPGGIDEQEQVDVSKSGGVGVVML